MDEDTVSRLMDVLSDTDVPWMKLAEKLGMKTLTQLYVDTKAPCQHLLQHYKVTPPPRPSDHMTCSSLTAVGVSSWQEVRSRF